MAVCFPFAKYAFFIVVFVISIVILKTSTTMEHMALILLTAFMAMFGLSLITDVFHDKQGSLTWQILSVPASAILIFTAILITTMGYHKLYLESKKANRDVHISEFFRNILERIKDYSLTGIVLLLSTLFMIMFFAEKGAIASMLHVAIDAFSNGRHLWVFGLRIVVAFIAFSLICAMVDKLEGSPIRSAPNEDDPSKLKRQKDVYTRFTAAGYGIPIFMVLFGLLQILYKLPWDKLPHIPVLSYVLNFIFTFISGIFSYIFSKVGIKITKIEQLPVSIWPTVLSRIIYFIFFLVFAVGLTTFIKDDMETILPFSVPFIVMIMLLMLSLLIEDIGKYLPNIIDLLLRKGLPLALLGFSGYLVYLGNEFFMYTKQESVA